jgi:Mg/Co/Ni transporter MgtE
VLKDLVNLANSLDSKGLLKEADLADSIIKAAEKREGLLEGAKTQMATNVVENWDPERLGGVAGTVDAEKLADIAEHMSPKKLADAVIALDRNQKSSVMNLLLANEEFKGILLEMLMSGELKLSGFEDVLSAPGQVAPAETGRKWMKWLL